MMIEICALAITIAATYHGIDYSHQKYVYIDGGVLARDGVGSPNDKGISYDISCIYRASRALGTLEPFFRLPDRQYSTVLGVNDRYVAVGGVTDASDALDDKGSTNGLRVYILGHDGRIVKTVSTEDFALAPGTSSDYAFTSDGRIVLASVNTKSEHEINWTQGWVSYCFGNSANAIYITLENSIVMYQRDKDAIVTYHRGYPFYESPSGAFSYTPGRLGDAVQWVVYDEYGELRYCPSGRDQCDLVGWIANDWLVARVYCAPEVRYIVLDCKSGNEWHVNCIPLHMDEDRVSTLGSYGKDGLHYLPLSGPGVRQGQQVKKIGQESGGRVDVDLRGNVNGLVFLSAPKTNGEKSVYTWQVTPAEIGNAASEDLFVKEGARTIPVYPSSKQELSCTCTYSVLQGELHTYGPVIVERGES